MAINAQHAQSVRERAERLYGAEEVAATYDRLAREISDRLGERDPVILCVMIGGLVPTAELLERFDFHFELDYVHATRYRGETSGGELHWRAWPGVDLAGRSVLVIDDILDEGHTLAGIMAWCREQGATEVLSAVLVEKLHDRRAAGAAADFTGLKVEDRYVFGCGMDYKGYLRNLDGIYAVGE